MRSAVPLFRTPATPWAMMRSPRRTAAAMPKRSPPLPSMDCRMASTLTAASSSSDEPAGLNRSDFDASIMFYRGRIGLEIGVFTVRAQLDLPEFFEWLFVTVTRHRFQPVAHMEFLADVFDVGLYGF